MQIKPSLTDWQRSTTCKILGYLRNRLHNSVFLHDDMPEEGIEALKEDIMSHAAAYTKFATGPEDFATAAGALVVAIKMVLGYDYMGENEESYLPNAIAFELGGDLEVMTAIVKRSESAVLKASIFNMAGPRRGRPRAAKRLRSF